jgi:hypothetical protein
MLEAIDRMFQFNQNRRIDMFKDGISVPGLVLKYMFQDLPDYFTVPVPICTTCTRTTSLGARASCFIVTTRKTRPSYDLPSTQTQRRQLIYGVDANAMYLWSIMQKMPTGHFVRRKKEDGFKRQTPRRYECMTIDWLEWDTKNTGQHIRHKGNDSEKLIGMKRLSVDVFCRHQHRLRIPGMYLAWTSILDDQKT